MKYRFINRHGWEKWIEANPAMMVQRLDREQEVEDRNLVGAASMRLVSDVYERELWRDGEDEEVVFIDRLGNPDVDIPEYFGRAAAPRKLERLVAKLEQLIVPFRLAEDQGKHAAAMFAATETMSKIAGLVRGFAKR